MRGHGHMHVLKRLRLFLEPLLSCSTAESQQPRCIAWIDHPLYFLNDKYDSLNLWHALEDVTHAFEAYALKGWGREAQVRRTGQQAHVHRQVSFGTGRHLLAPSTLHDRAAWRHLQVVVLDQATPESVLGPTYLAVWQKVFSPQHPPILLRDLVAESKAQHGGSLPPGAALCMKGILLIY